jgi:hypothetical protein
MRRFLIILMLLVVPFQLSWGMAAAYCTHESNPSVSHFGHHSHKHAEASNDEKPTTAKAKLSFDGDCEVCQLSGIGVTPSENHSLSSGQAALDVDVVNKPFPSWLLSNPPDRPQWARVVF